MKILYGVAVFAAILVRSGGELVVMGVLMAIRARRELNFIDGILACWRVALVASNGGMLSIQWIFRGGVLFYAE